MQTTTRPTYSHVYGMVMQLSPSDRLRLSHELADSMNEPYKDIPDEMKQMCAEASEDYKAGKYCTSEEGWKQLKEKFPWVEE